MVTKLALYFDLYCSLVFMLALPYYNTTTFAAGHLCSWPFKHIPVSVAGPTGLPADWMLVLNQIATVGVTNTLGNNQLVCIITKLKNTVLSTKISFPFGIQFI